MTEKIYSSEQELIDDLTIPARDAIDTLIELGVNPQEAYWRVATSRDPNYSDITEEISG